MSNIEDLLIPGSTEVPQCRCGSDMTLKDTAPTPSRDAEIRVYRCPCCEHELRLTVWAETLSSV